MWIRPGRCGNWLDHREILCPNKMKSEVKDRESLVKQGEHRFGHVGNDQAGCDVVSVQVEVIQNFSLKMQGVQGVI